MVAALGAVHQIQKVISMRDRGLAVAAADSLRVASFGYTNLGMVQIPLTSLRGRFSSFTLAEKLRNCPQACLSIP